MSGACRCGAPDAGPCVCDDDAEAVRLGREFWNLVDEGHPLRAEVERLKAELSAANARAEAAERKAQVPWKQGQAVDHESCTKAVLELYDRAERAEAEAAALRKELEHATTREVSLAEAANRAEAKLAAANAQLAEFEQRRDLSIEALRDDDPTEALAILEGDRGAVQDAAVHLVTAAEKAVLDMMGAVIREELQQQVLFGFGGLPAAAQAELARREAKR